MKKCISDDDIIEVSAMLANEVGLDNLSLKMIASKLDIKSPSLYNHFSSLDEIREKIMIYGWMNVGNKMIESTVGVTGYDAIRNMCYAFYDYASNNKGIFSAMLWYNMYDNEVSLEATKRLHEVIFEIVKPLNISNKNTKHCIRLMRSFLEGFALLEDNDAFGDLLSINESFDLSLEILINSMKSLEGK